MDSARDEKSIVISLVGQDMAPGKLASREIAELISAFEEMITLQVLQEHPQAIRNIVSVGLRKVEAGSLTLEFEPSIEPWIMHAIDSISQSVSTGLYEELHSNIIEQIRKIIRFSGRNKCSTRIFSKGEKLEELVEITADITIPQTYLLQGETSIYGELSRVGGREPKIQVKTIDGAILHCKADKNLVKKAGSMLYSDVEIYGQARWYKDSMEIESFTAYEIRRHSQIDPVDAFASLGSQFGMHFDDIEDVEGFVRELR